MSCLDQLQKKFNINLIMGVYVWLVHKQLVFRISVS